MLYASNMTTGLIAANEVSRAIRAESIPGYVDTIHVEFTKFGPMFSCDLSFAKTYAAGLVTLAQFAREVYGTGRLKRIARDAFGESYAVIRGDAKN